jgi:hypothetical protein
LAGIATLLGCSGREHTNPFDPLNPETAGMPASVRAVAGCHYVRLSWDLLGISDLAAIHIWRAVDGVDDPPGERLTTIPLSPEAAVFGDTTAGNGLPYTYAVEFTFASGAAAFQEPVQAEPGPALPWVSDACGWGLALLTPDCRSLVDRVGGGSLVLDLDIDAAGGRLFVPCTGRGEVEIRRTADGSPIAVLNAPGASCISWCAALDLLAVGAFYGQTVTWLDPQQGTQLGRAELTGHIEDVVMRDSSTTWVALYEGNLLRVTFPEGEIVPIAGDLMRAVAMADDPGGGGCWVADRSGGVVAYVAGDSLAFRTAGGVLSEPLDLRATGEGTCWVADRHQGGLILLDRECREVERITGLGHVSAVSYNPETGDLWATVSEDSEVKRIAPNGRIVSVRVAGCPLTVAGDWLGGCR